MKNGMIGGLLMACVVIGMYLASKKPTPPVPVAGPEPHTAPAAPIASSPPVVLGRVVEVTDIDPLLDPPTKPMSGTPFDADPEAVRVSAAGAPDRIPPAVD